MSKLNRNKSHSDLSSEESWSLIDESDPDLQKISTESIVIIEDEDEKDELVQPHCVESLTNVIKDTTKKSTKLPKKCSKKIKNKKKKDKDFSLFGMMACLLTISGISVLSTIFAGNNSVENQDVSKLETNFLQQRFRLPDPDFDILFNKTPDILASYSERLSTEAGDDICPLEHPFMTNVTLMEALEPILKEIELDSPKVTPSSSVKSKLESIVYNIHKAAKDPHVHLLVGTLLQNICLMKLLLSMWPEKKVVDAKDKGVKKEDMKIDNGKPAMKNKTKTNAATVLSLKTKRKLLEKRIRLFEKEVTNKKHTHHFGNYSPHAQKENLDITGVKIEIPKPNKSELDQKMSKTAVNKNSHSLAKVKTTHDIFENLKLSLRKAALLHDNLDPTNPVNLKTTSKHSEINGSSVAVSKSKKNSNDLTAEAGAILVRTENVNISKPFKSAVVQTEDESRYGESRIRFSCTQTNEEDKNVTPVEEVQNHGDENPNEVRQSTTPMPNSEDQNQPQPRPVVIFDPAKKDKNLTDSELSETFTEDEDPANPFKVVIRRKHRKREVYRAAFENNAGKIMLDDIIRWSGRPKIKGRSKEVSKQDPRMGYVRGFYTVIPKGVL